MTDGGDGVVGQIVSEETRRKQSEVRKGKKFTEEHKKNMGLSQVGPKNHRYGKGYLQAGEKNPMFGKGHLTAGEKNGMFGMTGEKNPMFGIPCTPEHKLKMKTLYGNAILYKGVKYLSVREASDITGVSRYFIKQNGQYIN